MLVSPLIYVVDTNVLINLYVGRILQSVFRLPMHLLVPNVLVTELQEPEGKLLLSYGLLACELSSGEVREVYHLTTQHRQVSVNDLCALVLARTLGAILLAGDRHLCRVANQERVSTRGMLWLLDEMVYLTVLPPRLAAQVLERMLDKGGRLPWKECEQRLKQWRDW